ncbi:RNA polymerase sigma factor, partial [Nonomuraea sp. RK-328]|nr:RNA polymerase sigma factor [Nonomuraea sp. RK-328]
MAPRISRAKQRIKAAGASFEPPAAHERAARLDTVLHVLYLIFNEGYTASSGPDLHRGELITEAIRLTRRVHRSLPDDGEVAGLLALMLLTDARRAARTEPDGALVPLAEQDRSRWDTAMIEEGTALVTDAMSTSLELLESLDDDPRIARHHRLPAVRAHLQELAGEYASARENYRLAARRTTSLPEQRYLRDRADKLDR